MTEKSVLELEFHGEVDGDAYFGKVFVGGKKISRFVMQSPFDPATKKRAGRKPKDPDLAGCLTLWAHVQMARQINPSGNAENHRRAALVMIKGGRSLDDAAYSERTVQRQLRSAKQFLDDKRLLQYLMVSDDGRSLWMAVEVPPENMLGRWQYRGSGLVCPSGERVVDGQFNLAAQRLIDVSDH